MTNPNASKESTDNMSETVNEVSLVSLMNVLMRRRALVVWSSLLCAALFTGYSLIGERTWTTVVSFFPQGKKSSGNLSALAAQFGVPVSTGDANESPNFYADLVKSRAILSTIIDSGVAVETGKPKVDLATAYEIKTIESALRRDMAMKQLNDNVAVSTNTKTGVVTMRVSSKSAPLSAAISARLLELLNRFNQETRRGQASAERKFTADRVTAVKKDLRNAEDAYQEFVQANRVTSAVSSSNVQKDRLERELRMQTELYTNLAKAYEQAKIDEVRDTPVITVVERPEPAARPDSRGILTKGIASLVAGFVLGVIMALIIDGLQGSGNSGNAEGDEFRKLGNATLRDLRRPWRLLAPIKV
ncbi:MAG: hypothetical protein ABJB66_04885 [Gemmatimonadaceae bacterium]